MTQKGIVVLLLAIGIASALGVACGQYFSWRHYRAELESMKPQIDTLVKRDTITKTKPVYVNRYVRDTFYLSLGDTIRVRDTLVVPVPIESKVYEDSTYRAVVSGFRPSLDSISVYQIERVITKSVSVPVQPRISIGIQAGAGLSIEKTPHFVPYIGFGAQYNLISFGKCQ